MILESLITIISFGIISLIVSANGYSILKYFHIHIESRNIRTISSFALGFIVASYGAYILGYLQLINTQNIILLLMFMFVTSLPKFKEFILDIDEIEFFTQKPTLNIRSLDSLIQSGLCILVTIILILLVIASIMPPSGWDALNYHLSVPKIFLEFGGITHLPTIFHSHFPLPVQFQFLVLMGITTASASSMLVFVYLLLTLVIMREMLKMFDYDRLSLLTTAILFSITVVLFATHETLIEPAAMFYVTLSSFLALQFIRKPSLGPLVLMGIIIGYASASKYSNLPFILLIPFAIWLVTYSKKKTPLRTLMLLVFVSAISTLPWYLRTWIDTSNPFWPYFLTFIDSNYSENIYTASGNTPGIGKVIDVETGRIQFLIESIGRILTKPFRMIFFPDQFGGDDPKAGPLLLGFIPLVLVRLPLWIKQKSELNFLLILSTSFFVIWLITFHNTRYLAPIFPLISILLAISYEQFVTHKAVKRTILLIVIGSLGLSLLITAKANLTKFDAYISSNTTSEYYTQLQSPYGGYMVREYAASEYINSISDEDTKVLILGGLFGYFLETPWDIGRYDAQSVYDYSKVESVEDISQLLEDNAITHILAPFSQTEEYTPRMYSVKELFNNFNLKEEEVKNGFDVFMYDYIPNHTAQLFSQHGVYVYKVSYLNTGLVLDGIRIVKNIDDTNL